MSVLLAGQLLYAHVDAAISPTGHDGFQTVCYTKKETSDFGVSADEIRAIESRLFFVPSGDDSRKYIYFTTETGRVAVAQITTIPGADRFGRKGRYIAHCLVVHQADFLRQCDNNPFRMFRSFGFCTELADLVELCEKGNWCLQPASISVSSLRTPGDDGVPWVEAKPLVEAAALRSDMEQNHESVHLLGSSLSVFEWLEKAYESIPTSLRLKCSFDTQYVGGILARQPYWGIGLPDDARDPGAIKFTVSSKKWIGSPRSDDGHPFLRWLDGIEDELSLQSPSSVSQAYDVLSRIVNGESFAGISIGTDILHSLLTVCREDIESRLRDVLQSQYGSIAARFSPEAVVEVLGTGDLAWLDDGAPPGVVRSWTKQFLYQTSEQMGVGELECIQKIADDELRLLLLRHQSNWPRLAHELQAVGFDVFSTYVERELGRFLAKSGLTCEDQRGALVIGVGIVGLRAPDRSLLRAIFGIPPTGFVSRFWSGHGSLMGNGEDVPVAGLCVDQEKARRQSFVLSFLLGGSESGAERHVDRETSC